ncbi:small, acid-soluble spore protein tlp [Sporosarcina sp. ACRSL]|uniref:small, acid-soluble spore protein tlp n=1 Tax=Sporosarcina sp. ACRSL TaxID=2918215 RepID=UPI001EF46649|nr:small, acid-soluble spore protein tlp [Sporosarcina sp. ACRSL]MCG7345928.1 small, acid-soluble spore protein tlp [Sporosarcina sp. ACRSL]
MPGITPRPNDRADKEERLNKTVSNKFAATQAAKTAEGAELASIKQKNARREEIIEELTEELHRENQ